MRIWEQYRGRIQLAGMVMMVPLAAWFFGFRRTAEVWSDCRARQARIEQLRMSEAGTPSVVPERRMGNVQVLNNGALLERISGVLKDNQVTLVKYVPYLTREEGMLQMYTGELVLAGGFIPLLKVMNAVEQPEHPEKMVSAGFQLRRDRGQKECQLRMTLVLQQLTMENK